MVHSVDLELFPGAWGLVRVQGLDVHHVDWDGARLVDLGVRTIAVHVVLLELGLHHQTGRDRLLEGLQKRKP